MEATVQPRNDTVVHGVPAYFLLEDSEKTDDDYSYVHQNRYLSPLGYIVIIVCTYRASNAFQIRLISR